MAQVAYRPRDVDADGKVLSVQEVKQPHGVPIAETAARCGWFVEIPPGVRVYLADGTLSGLPDPLAEAEKPKRGRAKSAGGAGAEQPEDGDN